MKILIPALHYYPVVGGIETWTRHIAEMISQKAEVFVVTGKVKGQPSREQSGGLKIVRTSLFTLKNLSRSPLIYTLSLPPFLFFKSLALIRKEKIEVVHCQGFLSSFVGFWLLKLAGVPYLVTVQRMEGKHNPLKEFIYRRAAVCIGASRAIGEYFEGIGCRNVEVIPNGIDLRRFENLDRQKSRQDLGLREEFAIMTVARLEKVKGVNYLIEAMAKGKLPEINCRLLIIGDGSERKNLGSLAEKLNLKERVWFLGEIPNEQIPSYLAAVDCFVLPSLREGFGIVLLEAQAAGVPVVGTKVGGILDIIEDGQTGLLVGPQSSQQIAEAVHKIYSGLRLPRVNLIKYDWQNIADRVYQSYQKVI